MEWTGRTAEELIVWKNNYLNNVSEFNRLYNYSSDGPTGQHTIDSHTHSEQGIAQPEPRLAMPTPSPLKSTLTNRFAAKDQSIRIVGPSQHIRTLWTL